MKTILALPLLALGLAACDTVPYAPYGGPDAAPYPQPYPEPYPQPYLPPALPADGAYRAIGTEPFWDLTIDRDLRFTDRGNNVSVSEPTPPVRSGFAGETYAGRRLFVNIVHSTCSDGMSDRSYPDTVNVTVDGHAYRGCGAQAAFFTSINEYNRPPVPPAQGVYNLANTNWRVVSVNGQPVPMSGYYLNFMPDRVSGKFGCNTIGAGYSVDGNVLHAGAVMATRMACENNNFEDRALPVMAKPMTITESGDRLTLSNSAGTIELTRAR
jgi:heat shock protein HslJ